MHKDTPVCAITVDASSGAILRVSKSVNPELLPLGGNADPFLLRRLFYFVLFSKNQGQDPSCPCSFSL